MEDHLKYYQSVRDELVERARLARDTMARSYRDFKVGCSVLVWTGKEYVIHSAGNDTPERVVPPRQGKEKRCAERQALELALVEPKEGQIVVAIVTFSKELATNPDDPRHYHDVLHPCPDCRQLLRELQAQGKITDETVMNNVHDREKSDDRDVKMWSEERSTKGLLSLYDSQGHRKEE